MEKSRFTETQIVSILKQADAGMPVKDVCRQAGISVPTYYQWKSKYGGLEASDLKRVKELEAENARLKRLYADLALENAAMKDLITKNYRAGSQARGGAVPHRGTCTAAAPVLWMRRSLALSLVRPAAGLDGARCRAHRGVGSVGPRAAQPRFRDVPQTPAQNTSELEAQTHLSRVQGHASQPAPSRTSAIAQARTRRAVRAAAARHRVVG